MSLKNEDYKEQLIEQILSSESFFFFLIIEK